MKCFYYKGRYFVECPEPPMEVSLEFHEEQDDVLKKEIVKQKESINAWKEAWYKLRDKLGRLYWNHPALQSDANLEQYRSYKNDETVY